MNSTITSVQLLLLVCCCFGFVGSPLSWHHQPGSDERGSSGQYVYEIEPESRLFLEGSSNVVDFTCDCTSRLGSGQFSIQAQQGTYRFSNGELRLPVAVLDCGNRAMNRDMYEALKADQHPTISVKLVQVDAPSPNTLTQCNEWKTFHADLLLTIAGIARTVKMEVHGAHLGYQLYHFRAKQAIYLTDYGIDPPRALLGTVRVDNCITINMDLQVRVTAE